MINYREEIESIFRDFDIYKYNVKFKHEKHQIEVANQIMNNQIENLPNSDNIAIWGKGQQTSHIVDILEIDNRKKVSFIIGEEKKGIDDKGPIKFIMPREMRNYNIKHVVVCSFCESNEIAKLIKDEDVNIEIIDCYKIFKKEGLKFVADSFRHVRITYDDIGIDLLAFDNCIEQNKKIKMVKKIIGNYFFIRDFVNAFKYIKKLEEFQDQELLKYQELIKKLEILFSEMQLSIASKKHIVVNLLDALRRDELTNLEFLNQQAKEGIDLTCAYTVIAATSSTLKTLLSGQVYIDDNLFALYYKEIVESSTLLKILGEHGYQFKYIGYNAVNNNFDKSLVDTLISLKDMVNEETPSSILQWELVCSLAMSTENCMALVHNLHETHSNFKNGVFKGVFPYQNHKFMDVLKFGTEKEKKAFSDTRKQSQRYIDEQLKWYHDIYKDAVFTIYMSDHGQYLEEDSFDKGIKAMMHTVFMINGKSVKQMQCDKVFSLLNFPDIVKHMLCDNVEAYLESGMSEYAIIQGEDIYSIDKIKELGKETELVKLLWLQRRGVITSDDLYVKLVTGEEFYFRENINGNLIHDVRWIERINELKKIAGNTFIDIYQTEKFENTRKWFEDNNYIISNDIELKEL